MSLKKLTDQELNQKAIDIKKELNEVFDEINARSSTRLESAEQKYIEAQQELVDVMNDVSPKSNFKVDGLFRNTFRPLYWGIKIH